MPSILARQPSTSSHDEGSLTIGSVALSSESVWTPVDLALMQHGHRRRSTVKYSTALSTKSVTSLSINTGKPNRPVVLVNPYGATDYDICVLATFEDSPPDELCKLLQHFIIPVAPNCGHPTVGGDTAIVFDPPLHYQSPHQWLLAFRYTPKTPLVSYSQARVAGRTPSITPESMEWLENEEIARRNSLEHMVAQDPNLGEVLRAEAQAAKAERREKFLRSLNSLASTSQKNFARSGFGKSPRNSVAQAQSTVNISNASRSSQLGIVQSSPSIYSETACRIGLSTQACAHHESNEQADEDPGLVHDSDVGATFALRILRLYLDSAALYPPAYDAQGHHSIRLYKTDTSQGLRAGTV
ncbi:uncharacterized protein STEHIDRAFT_154641 [Stereum hirsutum FP-91666 SS1]|uniref:uncharacterized protein n=1 Tax=Stereum hirsutum (strain FP-91666) TaxID=721885 RepID=UPI000440F6DD|nr:uncharacterized protein STEHIDRAFT_154641 [Stereum hirsutum FP-91666 SS1]EIM88934.1 hypothetical protein STEHIDRAFT_154641 [Stereum hirsutum FP-91666 SS1]